jgi:hypothetical protein
VRSCSLQSVGCRMEGWFEKAGRLVLTDRLKAWTAWRLHWTGITGLKDHDRVKWCHRGYLSQPFVLLVRFVRKSDAERPRTSISHSRPSRYLNYSFLAADYWALLSLAPVTTDNDACDVDINAPCMSQRQLFSRSCDQRRQRYASIPSLSSQEIDFMLFQSLIMASCSSFFLKSSRPELGQRGKFHSLCTATHSSRHSCRSFDSRSAAYVVAALSKLDATL